MRQDYVLRRRPSFQAEALEGEDRLPKGRLRLRPSSRRLARNGPSESFLEDERRLYQVSICLLSGYHQLLIKKRMLCRGGILAKLTATKYSRTTPKTSDLSDNRLTVINPIFSTTIHYDTPLLYYNTLKKRYIYSLDSIIIPLL